MKAGIQKSILAVLSSMLFVQAVSAQVETNGSLWAMGDNDYGQLGDGKGTNGVFTNLPETIVPTNVTAIAAGGLFSLYLLTDGSLWGMGDQSFGELGDGTNGVHGTTPLTNKPEMIVPSNVIAVAAGAFYSMFIKIDGSLWGMGDNSNGELGDGLGGSGVLTNRPEMIVSNGVSAVACGLYHTLFLTTNGTLWAMGSYGDGQLGNGLDSPGFFTNKPVIITNGVVAIACGGDHSLFITTNGNLYAMGDDQYGQLGDGNGGLIDGNTEPYSVSTPELITNGVVAIAGGTDHSLFVRTNGSLWAMGNGGDGQLGDGSNNAAVLFPEMIVPSNVTAVACGPAHSLFIKSDGSLWAMGADHYGQLGNGMSGGGATFGTNVPVQIVPSGVLAVSSGHEEAAGFAHTLFIAPAMATVTSNTYTVSSSSVGGTASSSGTGVTGSTVIVTATNDAGYAFVNWISNGVVVSTMTNYSFTLNADVTLVATFAPLFTYTTSASPGNAGTVSLGGSNAAGSAITVTATNNTGYVFNNWTSNGVMVSSTTNYTFDLNTNVTLVANFLPLYTITVLAYPPDGGTVGGSVTNVAGSTNTVTATNNSGFAFIGWAGAATGTNNPLMVTLNTNLGIIAYFAPVGTSNITVTVTTNGYGKVSPNLNGLDLKAGTRHTLTATAASGCVFSNWTGSITTNKNPLTIKVESSLVLQANFITNPFTPFVGTYNGLFINTNGIVTVPTAGMLKGLHISSKGVYSGSLLINGATHGITGTFTLGGMASNFIVRPEGQGDLKVLMTLNGSSPIARVKGTVMGTTWVADLAAVLATNTLPSAEYTILMPPVASNAPPTNSPGGDGYALITNYAGTAKNPALATTRITGALADGTAISQTVPVSEDGYVPIYNNLYASKGLLLGWINLDSMNTNHVSLTWIHPERTTGLYQPGFTNILLTNQILLSPWTNPPTIFDQLTVFSMLDTIDDTNALTNITVGVTAEGKVTGTGVSGTVNLKTGLWTMIIDKEPRITAFGAILANATNGGGYYLTKTNAQAIKLGP